MNLAAASSPSRASENTHPGEPSGDVSLRCVVSEPAALALPTARGCRIAFNGQSLERIQQFWKEPA